MNTVFPEQAKAANMRRPSLFWISNTVSRGLCIDGNSCRFDIARLRMKARAPVQNWLHVHCTDLMFCRQAKLGIQTVPKVPTPAPMARPLKPHGPRPEVSEYSALRQGICAPIPQGGVTMLGTPKSQPGQPGQPGT